MLELREKARHYKTRAIQGNYFSREYLAQLDAELEQLYEEQSKNRETRGMLDVPMQDHGHAINREALGTRMHHGGMLQGNWDDLILNVLGEVRKVAKILKMEKEFTEI